MANRNVERNFAKLTCVLGKIHERKGWDKWRDMSDRQRIGDKDWSPILSRLLLALGSNFSFQVPKLQLAAAVDGYRKF